jgi:hypothetical protein
MLMVLRGLLPCRARHESYKAIRESPGRLNAICSAQVDKICPKNISVSNVFNKPYNYADSYPVLVS